MIWIYFHNNTIGSRHDPLFRLNTVWSAWVCVSVCERELFVVQVGVSTSKRGMCDARWNVNVLAVLQCVNGRQLDRHTWKWASKATVDLILLVDLACRTSIRLLHRKQFAWVSAEHWARHSFTWRTNKFACAFAPDLYFSLSKWNGSSTGHSHLMLTGRCESERNRSSDRCSGWSPECSPNWLRCTGTMTIIRCHKYIFSFIKSVLCRQTATGARSSSPQPAPSVN